MSIPNSIYAALGPLVSNRAWPDEFPMPSGQPPVAPAIRYVLIGGEVFTDACGSDADTGNPRYQFDVVAATAAGRDALVAQVQAALALLDPPAILQGLPLNDRDTETRLYRATFDYVFYPSSGN